MISNLDELLSRKPRGPEIGDEVSAVVALSSLGNEICCDFRVVALQQVTTTDTTMDVGLVWAFTCRECNRPDLQFTPIRPARLTPMCSRCDVVGTPEADVDIAAVDSVVRASVRSWPAVREVDGLRAKGVKRRGRLENHILQVLKDFEGDTVKLEDLIGRAVARFPAPEEGERDTRRQRMIRAIAALAKEKDGPLSVENGTVILYE